MKKAKRNQHRVAIILLLATTILITLLGMYFWFFKKELSSEKKWTPPVHEQWMTVFIHGSFGSVLGLLNVMDVIQDNVDKTNYKKMTSHMRHNPYFYQMQPLQEPGLKEVNPSFDISKLQEKRFAAPPVAQAYDELTEYISERRERNRYYTFGWSGLISQLRRRKESVRLFNMLQEEVERLKQQGITPKIRLIAHSHGGNTAVNLAAVRSVLENGLENEIQQTVTMSQDHLDSLKKMQEHIKGLGTKEEAQNNTYQKKWDYRPLSSKLFIDELITLGTPIQPETDQFFLSSIFGSVVNIYSDNDIIQSMDWVSTKRYYSDKRIAVDEETAKKSGLRQLRLMVNRVMDETPEPVEEKKRSWIDWISSKKKNLSDPNHKELWFMSWRTPERDASVAQSCIKPYPFAILLPIMRSLWEKAPDERDIDINIVFKENVIEFGLYRHATNIQLANIEMPRSILRNLQDKISHWKPEDLTPTKEMSILQQYSAQMGA